MYVVHQHWLYSYRLLSHFVICLLVTTSLVVCNDKQTSDTNFNNITDSVLSPQLDQNLMIKRSQPVEIYPEPTFDSGKSTGISTHLLNESSTGGPTSPTRYVTAKSSRSGLGERSTFSSSNNTDRHTTDIKKSNKTSSAAHHSLYSTIPFSDQPTTSAYLEEKGMWSLLRCEKFRRFTEMFNLCDPFQNLDSHHSCKDRCGQVFPLEEAFENCYCDVTCLAYHDCCVDFSLQCPQLYSHSRRLESVFYVSSCMNELPYRAIRSCPNYGLATALTTSAFTTSHWATSTTTSISDINSVTSTESPQRKITGLEHYSRKYSLVANLNSGIVYSNMRIYRCNAGTDSTPYFLPYVLPLTGSYVAGESIESYVFPHSPHFYHDPYILHVDPLLRACFNDETIHCSKCAARRQAKISLLCQALRTQDSLTMFELDKYTGIQGRETLNHHGSCTQFAPSQFSTQYWSTQRKYTTEYVSPSLTSWMAARRHYEQIVNKLGAFVTIRRSSFKSSEYILEFKGAPWKTIRCSDPSLSLDDCDIECHGRYKALSQGCIQPTNIEVYIETKELKETDNGTMEVGQDMPICLCFAVYSAIKDTNIWNLGTLYWNASVCDYEIKNVLSSRDQANEAEMTTFEKEFKHVSYEHTSACSEQYHSISTCFKFKHHKITGSKCFTFAHQEISKTTPKYGDSSVRVLAASSSPSSGRLNVTFEVVTLMLVYQYCTPLVVP